MENQSPLLPGNSAPLPPSFPAILPLTARANAAGHLEIGGCDCVALATEFGTPLYVFDEATLRERCRAYRQAFSRRYADSQVCYASKAWLHPALAVILAEEGLALDVVSGGELYVARQAGFPLAQVTFHGNNKSPAELAQALEWGIGRVVVDNWHEMEALDRLAVERGRVADVLLRLAPGVDPHTHAHITTGVVDSKFGFPLVDGQAEAAVQRALTLPGLRLLGLHAHIGSQIFELEPYRQTVRLLLAFAAEMASRYGFRLREFSPGGGWAIRYTAADDPPTVEQVAGAVVNTLRQEAVRLGLPLPRLLVEPGRSIVGPAGVALYTVGGRKDAPGGRRYLFVDGGMADNIRPALYDARYVALAANKVTAPVVETVAIAGKYCDAGDVLIREAALPALLPGDLLAVSASGAYCLSLASNYNLALRPAVVLVNESQARLIRRRESYEDLLRLDVWP